MPNDIEYVLDSSIIINFLASQKDVVDKMTSIDPDRTVITAVCLAEIFTHLLDRRPNSDQLTVLLETFNIVPISSSVAIKFAKIKHAAKIKGCGMDRDIWMASFAEEIGATLLTADKQFAKRMAGLNTGVELIDISER